MEIFIAKYSGFCEGVERAYRISLDKSKINNPVFMLGYLVHNSYVIEKLKDLGVKTVKDISEVPVGAKGVLIISAHGVSPAIYEKAHELNLEIIDTTCAWVRRAQQAAKNFKEEGRLVVIVGDKGHVEVQGLLGWADDKAVVLESLEDAKKLVVSESQKVGIIAQTTQSEDYFKEIVSQLQKELNDVKVFNTICNATTKRQSSAVELASQVDLMVVVGDIISANTKRLFELCQKTGTETHQIQSFQEFKVYWLNDKNKIGITAGASTPDWVVKEVVDGIALASIT